jgi:hypothetical protein
MAQRVNIQYSIDIKELPGEMEGFLSKAERKLGKCHQELQKLIARYQRDILMTPVCSEEISVLRQTLTDVDFILEDTTTIINGYVAYQVRPKDSSVPGPDKMIEQRLSELQKEMEGATSPGEDETNGTSLNETISTDETLEAKIKTFKNMME